MSPTDLAFIAVVYIGTVLSPGPSAMAIAATAMSSGRRPAMALALGVWCGSVSWCAAAAFGMSAVMLSHAWILETVRIMGGLYLLWLGWKSARAALRRDPVPARPVDGRNLRRAWLKGVAMHLTNPKAILFFGSLFALVVKPDASPLALAEVVMVTGFCGAFLFPGYAMLFSTRRAMEIYARLRRWLEGAFGALFAAAGIGLLVGGVTR